MSSLSSGVSDSAPHLEPCIQSLQELAARCLRPLGLAPQEQDECIQVLLVLLLTQYLEPLQVAWRSDDFPAWVRRCTLNYARNYWRQKARRHQHELLWGELPESAVASWVAQDTASQPEGLLVPDELHQRLVLAFESLKPPTRYLV